MNSLLVMRARDVLKGAVFVAIVLGVIVMLSGCVAGSDGLTPRQSIADVRIKWDAVLKATASLARNVNLNQTTRRRLSTAIKSGAAAVDAYDVAAAGCTEVEGRIVALPDQSCDPIAYGTALQGALGFVTKLRSEVLANGGKL